MSKYEYIYSESFFKVPLFLIATRKDLMKFSSLPGQYLGPVMQSSRHDLLFGFSFTEVFPDPFSQEGTLH
jgi:hypothetical protein